MGSSRPIIETLITVWKNRKTFESKNAILGTITQYLQWRAFDWNRKKRIKLTDLDSRHDSADTEDDISQLELINAYHELQKIYQFVETMENQAGEVMRLYFIQQMKLTEIAVSMNLSPETIRTYKNRGIEIIREEFRYLTENERNSNIIRAMMLVSELAFLIFS